MTHSTYPARREAGVFFRDVLRMYDICTTARKIPTTTAGIRVTIEVYGTCVTWVISPVSSHAGSKNVVQIGARFWRFFCHQVALRGVHGPGFALCSVGRQHSRMALRRPGGPPRYRGAVANIGAPPPPHRHHTTTTRSPRGRRAAMSAPPTPPAPPPPAQMVIL